MDLSQVTTFFQTRQGLGVLGLVAIAGYLLYRNWSTVKAYIPGFNRTTTTTKEEDYVPTRREVMDHLDAAFIYFEDAGCKEGMEHIKQAAQHAFTEHQHTVASTETQDAVGSLVKAVQDALKPTPSTVTVAVNPSSDLPN